MIRCFLSLTVFFACCVASTAFAYETWPAENMQLRLETDAFTAFAKTQYQHTGDILELLDAQSPGSFQAVGLHLDAEFGLFEDIALNLQTTVVNVRLESESSSAAVAGVADLILGGKWKFVDGAFTLTAAPAVKFPTGYTPDPGPYMPSLGNGVNEYEAMLWAGKWFEDAPFYIEIGFGYRFRGTRVPRGGGPKVIYADELPYGIELAFDPSQALRVYGLLDGVYGLGTPDAVTSVELQPLTQDYLRLGGGVGYRVLDQLRVLATYRLTAAGVNALNEQVLTLGAEIEYGLSG